MKSDPVPLAIICQPNLCFAEILVFVRPSAKRKSVWKHYLVGQCEVMTFGKKIQLLMHLRGHKISGLHICVNT